MTEDAKHLLEKRLLKLDLEFSSLAVEHGKLWNKLPENDEAYARCCAITERQKEIWEEILDIWKKGIDSFPNAQPSRRENTSPAYDGSRYWIDGSPLKTPFKWTCAVVDEEVGGVIAYFSNEDDAKVFIDACIRERL